MGKKVTGVTGDRGVYEWRQSRVNPRLAAKRAANLGPKRELGNKRENPGTAGWFAPSDEDRKLPGGWSMARTVVYWITTGIVAAMSLLAAFTYLSGSPQAVEGFAHVGYPQQLRVLLGIAKLLGAITLLSPGLVKLKEWAYAGFTFAWIAATVAHYLAHDGGKAYLPLVLLALLAVSYWTRPESRQWIVASKFGGRWGGGP